MAQAANDSSATNPYIDAQLQASASSFSPGQNKAFESLHCVVKAHQQEDATTNYSNVLSSSDSESDDGESVLFSPRKDEALDRKLRGDEENTQKLVTKYMRDEEEALGMAIPGCIGQLCYAFFCIPTDVLFNEWDNRISHYLTVSESGKRVKVASRTVCIFSEDGYDHGHHVWHMKCHAVYNCQAIGVTEYKNCQYRFGDNIFDVALNDQLGDRYIYAGDSGHSWRGSNELRPYVCSVYDKEEYYSKKLKLRNSRWSPGDIITVDLWLGKGTKGKGTMSTTEADEERRTITFLKNGEPLHDPIRVVKKCKYYPVFQCYQRGEFEIIDDVENEPAFLRLKEAEKEKGKDGQETKAGKDQDADEDQDSESLNSAFGGLEFWDCDE